MAYKTQDCSKVTIKPKRRCHDCGKPCHDYRCAECWRKLRAEDDYYMAPHSGQADSMEVVGI